MSTPSLSRATIRPYLDPEGTNMGLEKYNLSVFDHIKHEETITCLSVMGQDRYVTGLDEFAPEIDKILDKEEKAARIKEIRTTVSYLESRLGGRQISEDDPEFWNKVVVLKPNNHEFWKEVKLVCGNDPVELQPTVELRDLLRIHAIKAGGFCLVAPSLEEARRMMRPPKFFLDEQQATLTVKTEIKKLRNKAGAALDKMAEREINKLMLVAKAIDANSLQYRKSTNPDIMYENIDLFLDGKLDGNLKPIVNINKFLKIVAMDMQTLKLQAVVRDATLLKVIARRSEGIYDMLSGSLLGKTVEEVVEFLKNPLHDSLLQSILERVETHWK